MKYILIILLFLSMPHCSFALSNSHYYGYCFQPQKPSCIDSLFNKKFKDEFALSSCKREIEEYVRNRKKFVSCAQDELSDNAKKDINKIMCKFNCKVDSKDFCSC